MNSVIMRMCVHMFYLANSICAEFCSNTAKHIHCHAALFTTSMSVNHPHHVWLKEVKVKEIYTNNIHWQEIARNSSLCAPFNLIWMVDIKLHRFEQNSS